MKKYQRLLENTLNRLVENRESKIIAILGSRQVGKTTLLKEFSLKWNGPIISYLGDKLEDARLWRGEFKVLKNNIEVAIGRLLEEIEAPVLLIFDEIQKIPEAFNNLKILADEYKGKIKIAISGSSSLALLHRTSESLGGRVEIATMQPLSLAEILQAQPQPVWIKNSLADFEDIKTSILKGALQREEREEMLNKALSFGLFPEAFGQEKIEEVRLLHQNYHQTYIEKDVRDLREVGNVLDFDMVWKIAHRSNGQLLNYSNISKETGLAFNTVKKYISVLVASYNLILLNPFIRNIQRRMVKSPKLFSVDLGFFNHSLNIYGKEEMMAAGFIGQIFESMMVTEFLKQEKFFLSGGEPYFFRTSIGTEVDLVIERGLDLLAYEFKFSEKISASDFSGIKSLMAAGSSKAIKGFVVSRQPYAEKFGDNLIAIPWWYLCGAHF